MYRIKNNRSRVTAVALIGKGIILHPKGRPGDSALILDREISEASVKGLKRMGAIKLEKVATPAQPPVSAKAESKPEPAPEESPAAQKAHLRVENTVKAETRAKERNRSAATKSGRKSAKRTKA